MAFSLKVICLVYVRRFYSTEKIGIRETDQDMLTISYIEHGGLMGYLEYATKIIRQEMRPAFIRALLGSN